MDNDDPIATYFTHKLIAYIAGVLLLGYVGLAVEYPVAWAAVTGVLFVLGMGLLTTRIVCRFESAVLMWLLTPVFGLAWLSFFYILWLLRDVEL